jgi:hypothetical protein
VALTVAAAYADTITYDFVGTGAAFSTPSSTFSPEPVGFLLTVSNFVNPPMNGGFVLFTCGQLVSSTNCLVGLPDAVTFSNQSVLGGFSAQLTFAATNNVEYAFFFPTGAFGTPGSYNSGGNNPNVGTLTVYRTPEPTPALLILTGGVLLLLTFKSWQGRHKLGRR